MTTTPFTRPTCTEALTAAPCAVPTRLTSASGWWQRVRAALITERSRLYQGLQRIPWLEPFPSQANFVLCRVHGRVPAKQVKDMLAQQHGVMVRHYAKKELSGFIRISVGKPEHTDAVLGALADFNSAPG